MPSVSTLVPAHVGSASLGSRSMGRSCLLLLTLLLLAAEGPLHGASAPMLDAIEPADLAFTENGAATVVSALITATDADSTKLTTAKATISGNYRTGEDS